MNRALRRLLGFVMLLYPADFRERFGRELHLDFQRVLRSDGPRSAALFVLDVFTSAMCERVRFTVARVAGVTGLTLCVGHFVYDLVVPDDMGIQAILMTSIVGVAGIRLLVSHTDEQTRPDTRDLHREE